MPDLRVTGVGDAGNVVSVAERKEGEERERGVFRGVDTAHHVAPRGLEGLRDFVWKLEPDSDRFEGRGRQVEGFGAEQILSSDSPPFEAGDGRGDFSRPSTTRKPPPGRDRFRVRISVCFSEMARV